ncbi:KH domain-containing protein [Patescibacteria group bacterium]
MLENSMAVKDQEFVEQVVKSIVSHPEDVSTERTVDERGVLITLKINQEDMGYVIGRKGQTARAIRTLVKIVGAQNNARVNLKIEEPEGSMRRTSEASEVSTDASDISTDAVDELKI